MHGGGIGIPAAWQVDGDHGGGAACQEVTRESGQTAKRRLESRAHHRVQNQCRVAESRSQSGLVSDFH